MKKILTALFLGLLISTASFAAVATVTTTEYGYSITGGTSATPVASGDSVIVKAFVFSPSVSTDTCTITTGSGNTTLAVMTGATNSRFYIGDAGIPVSNINVTLSATGDVLAIVRKG